MAGFSPSTYGALAGLLKDTVAGAGIVKGDKGDTGKEVELDYNATHLLWRYVGDVAWKNWISFDDLAALTGLDSISTSTDVTDILDGLMLTVSGGQLAGVRTGYTHTQSIAADTWTISHNLDQQFVGIRVYDFSGMEMIPDIDYTSTNVTTLSFAAPRQGIAHILR